MDYKNIFLGTLLLALPLTVAAQDTDAQTANVADDGKVPVAFGRAELSETLGGVSTVDMEELTKKNYNTYSLDNIQGYIGGWTGNSLWGMDEYLVLVDGVPRSANNVKPEEIKDITFLKGAQAVVLYGSRGAKGVVLITTKRGKEGDLRLSVRANTGWNVAKSFPEYLSSAEYMTLYNEARANDGLSPLYSDEDIYNYGSGLNPYRYPNVDFYSSDYVKKAYNRSEISTEISGGGTFAKYYANIGFYRTGDYLKFGEAEHNYSQKLNVRGNVDLRLNDFISAYVNANVSFSDSKSPVGANYWEEASTFRPNRVAPLIPMSYLDPNALTAMTMLGETDNIFGGRFLAGTQSDLTNIFANYYAAGKSKYTSRQFQFDAGVDVALDKVLKGLSFHTQFSVDYATNYSTSYNNDYATYRPTWSNYGGKDVIVGLTKYNIDKHSGVQNISGSTDNQVMAFNAHFDYKNTFNDVHNVSAMLLASGFQQSYSGQYHKDSNANLGLQLGYNYAHRYFAEFSAAAIHSARLASGHREAISPSLSLGWNIARESFMEGSVFDDLLLSASLSSLNTDLGFDDYYMYKGAYIQENYGGGWAQGVDVKYVQSQRGDNPDLGFIKRKEFSVNLKAAILKRMLTADLSFFTNKMEGLIVSPQAAFPIYFFTYYPEQTFVPYLNYNDDTRTGFDFSLNFQKKFGQMDFHAGINGTYYKTNASKRDDTDYVDAYQHRQGQPVDAMWGYQCIGFFQDADDIANSPSQTALSGNIAPGDLKYKDQNNDGIIDTKDQIYLGKAGWYGNPFTLGLNLSASYKGFTLFALATGGFGAKGFKNNSYWWIDGEDKYSAVVRNRWTPETAATATYPRLTTGDGANNFTNSDFWIYKRDQFNLAKVQLTYDFPSQMFQNKWVRGLSAYVSGNNLLMLAKERKYMEMAVGETPNARFYNIGVKVSF